MGTVFKVQEAPTVNVAGTGDSFPVHRIYCVGQNYVNHVREMGANPERETPFFFSKPSDAVCPEGTQVPYPMATDNLHHEVELIVAVGKNGINIPASEALVYVFAFSVGLDLTRRDLQKYAKKKGRPGLQPKVLTDLLLVLICIRWRKLVT